MSGSFLIVTYELNLFVQHVIVVYASNVHSLTATQSGNKLEYETCINIFVDTSLIAECSTTSFGSSIQSKWYVF